MPGPIELRAVLASDSCAWSDKCYNMFIRGIPQILVRDHPGLLGRTKISDVVGSAVSVSSFKLQASSFSSFGCPRLKEYGITEAGQRKDNIYMRRRSYIRERLNKETQRQRGSPRLLEVESDARN